MTTAVSRSLVAAWLGVTALMAAESRPNVVVIVADDLGFADCGLTGQPGVPTPHIDAIAVNGVRFTNSYASAGICSPSRAGLLTGRYQERWGHDGNECQDLPLEERTLGDRFRELGYVTGMVGKWHEGDAPAYWPTQRGFDDVFHPAGNALYYGAKVLDSRVSSTFQPAKDPQAYTTDLNAARAADFIGRHAAKPFFLYVAFNNVHGPWQVPDAYVRRVAIATPHEDRRTMLGMIIALDDAVGKVTEALRQQGLLSNTLVVFINDNGSYESYVKQGVCSNAPFSGGKSTLLEGGIRVPCAMQWPGRIPAQSTFAPPVIALDILPTAVVAAGGTVKPAWNIDGVDLMPYVTGAKTGMPHELLFWRMGAKQAVRKGDWKLRSEGGKDRLYQVVNDPGERIDCAAKETAVVAELRSAWNAWNATLALPRTGKLQKKKTNEE